jgi:hypothetical protein
MCYTSTVNAKARIIVATATVLAALMVAPAMSSAYYRGFQSPSHNIGCYLTNISGPWAVRCDIAKRAWAPPRRPSWCPADFGDYGQGLDLSVTGRSSFVCAGDTALFAGPVLRYGATISAGQLSCTSLVSGMRCVSHRSHHGFMLSRQSAQRF